MAEHCTKSVLCRTVAVPQQTNGDDCGVFMMGFIEDLVCANGSIPVRWTMKQRDADAARLLFSGFLKQESGLI